MKHKRIHTHGRRVLALLLAAILTVCTGVAAAAEVSAHVHVQSEQPQIENVVPPTCASEGSYDEVIRCRYCGEVMERKNVTVAKTTQHQPGEPVVENKKDAKGCVDPVVRYDSVVYCEVCGKELSRTGKEYGVSAVHIPDNSLKRTVRSDPEGGVLVTFDDPAVPPLHKDGNLPEEYDGAVIEADRYLLNDGSRRTCLDGETRCAVCGELLEPAIPHIYDMGQWETSDSYPWTDSYFYTCLLCGATKTLPIGGGCTGRARYACCGDVDRDYRVTAEDARLTLRAAVGLEPPESGSRAFCCADYDCDGVITPADARSVLRTAVSLQPIVRLIDAKKGG